MSSIKDFKDQNGYVLAHAAIPDGYQIGGSLVNGFQHESVPFFVTVHAVNPETKAIIYGLTDEKYTTYKNQMIKMTLKAMSDVKWNSIRDFIEPEVYLDTFAAALSGMPSIKAVGKADLPSICGKNQQQAFNDFMALYQDSFDRDASLGTPTRANNILVKSFMRKYDGVAKSGAACTVIAGMDYNGIEYYSEASMLGAISPLAGLLGAAVKNKQAAGSSKKFGQGSPCDAIDWGAKNKFLLVCPKEHERAALVDFMEFVQTFHMDPHLRNQFYQQISQRIQMRMQETHTDQPYEPLSLEVNEKWTYPGSPIGFSQEKIIYELMSKNKFLKIWVLCGYYDMATPFFAAEWVYDHVFLNKGYEKNLKFTYYPSGHMIYMHKPSLVEFKEQAERWYRN